jgi:hypothetical protein
VSGAGGAAGAAAAPTIDVQPVAGTATTESGGAIALTISLGRAPVATVSIAVASSNTAEGIPSPTAVVFTPTNYYPKTIVVVGQDDHVADGDIAYQITMSVVSPDPAYAKQTIAPVQLVNVDNDVPAIVVTPSGPLTTTEAGGTATATVVLGSQPTSNVTVALTSSRPSEGVVAPASLTFTPTSWNVPQTITFTGVNDAVVDGDQPYLVNGIGSSTDPKYQGLLMNPVSLVNIDNDPVPHCADPKMIDDMEDDDAVICPSGGRSGHWYVVNDGTGTQVPPTPAAFTTAYAIPGGRQDSVYAMHSSGSHFSGWGALFGFSLNQPDGSRRATYNCNGFTGIHFWARQGTGAQRTFNVQLPTILTSPTVPDGDCLADCNDHFQIKITPPTTWTEYSLRFSDFRQEGWGNRVTFYLADIFAIEFLAKAAPDFDLYVDDISFY